MIQILSSLKKLTEKAEREGRELYTDEELKQRIYIQLSFLEAFQFNNLNLLICEKSLAVTILSTLILELYESRRRCQDNKNKSLNAIIVFDEDDKEKSIEAGQ